MNATQLAKNFTRLGIEGIIRTNEKTLSTLDMLDALCGRPSRRR